MAARASDRELDVTRVFDAPRSLVFEAWTMRELGPKDYGLPFCEVNFHPGGAYRFCMRSPEGRDYWVRGIYREIVAPEANRLDRAPRERSLSDAELLKTITFDDLVGKARVTVHQAQFKTVSTWTSGPLPIKRSMTDGLRHHE